MTTTDERVPDSDPGGRHRRNDMPPDDVLAEAVRAWRAQRAERRRSSSAGAPAGSAAGVSASTSAANAG